ncbi:MAG TPA: hydroxymethylbilane synthase, partial [Myxococcales bacterium]
MTLRIGTRKSALALWQAERVQGWLRERGEECELVPMSTEGDRIVDRPLAEVGGKGLFVKELEQALHEGRADLAVHSAKDVPFALPEGFVLSAFPVREDPRDALIAPFAKTFENLPRGARVGTSSLRRAVQLLAARPDLVIVPVRGNVHTRLARATGAKVLRGGVEVRPADGDPQGPLDGVMYGIDNTFLTRGLDADLFVPYQSPALADVPAEFQVDSQHRVTPIDYGDVCLNYDVKYFTDHNLALPTNLKDLIDPM